MATRSAENNISSYDAAAEVYDEWTAGLPDTVPSVEFLAARAGDGPVLELGVGTGRVALPLARRGVTVVGIEGSQPMVDRLRGHPGGADLPVIVGDFAEVPADGPFPLVYSVFNTMYGLLSQEQQVRCLMNVAKRLASQGQFVVEASIPDLSRTGGEGRRLATASVERDRVLLEATMHDPVRQRVRTQVVVVAEAGVRLYPMQQRYIWPSELDLMAQLAGLRLAERYGGWQGEPFSPTSSQHVSVYRPA